MHRQRKCLQCTGALLALVLLFCGCTGPGSPATVPGNTTPPGDTGPISSLRTGIATQGIYEIENASEYTEDGIYVIDSFEFLAFCLLEAAEPCYESASLAMFGMDNFKEKYAEMMEEFKENFKKVKNLGTKE